MDDAEGIRRIRKSVKPKQNVSPPPEIDGENGTSSSLRERRIAIVANARAHVRHDRQQHVHLPTAVDIDTSTSSDTVADNYPGVNAERTQPERRNCQSEELTSSFDSDEL